MPNTSWSPVQKWYGNLVGDRGHYYHQHVILPKLKALYEPRPGQAVLDVGCGQGVYARTLPPGVEYVGVDLGKNLIAEARTRDRASSHQYLVADATEGLPVEDAHFDLAVSVLAIQNMADGEAAIYHLMRAVKPGGHVIIVLNHPCFRIPRQSSWGVDEQNKLEYRRVNRYLSPLKVPLSAHPGQINAPVIWSYHEPLSYYVHALTEASCCLCGLEEWVSDKESAGSSARRENRARSEFPLFLTLHGVKNTA